MDVDLKYLKGRLVALRKEQKQAHEHYLRVSGAALECANNIKRLEAEDGQKGENNG